MTIISGKQSLGQRDNQEDAFDLVYQNERDPKSDILMLVADGMGGHAGGEVASNLALSAFKKHFVGGSDAPRPRDRLQESLTAANEALRQRIATQPDLKGMGCTLVAALKLGDRLIWVSVGDSSLFLLRDGRLKKLNADHSLYGELLQMVAAGKLSQEEADSHPRRNALRSALMGDRISLTDVNAISLKPGDVVLSCSDGLDTLSQAEIREILQNGKSRDMRGVASDLLNAVEAKGKAEAGQHHGCRLRPCSGRHEQPFAGQPMGVPQFGREQQIPEIRGDWSGGAGRCRNGRGVDFQPGRRTRGHAGRRSRANPARAATRTAHR